MMIRLILAILFFASNAQATILISGREPIVGIQFDDGGVTHYTVARPILVAHGLTASFGITTGLTDIQEYAMTSAMIREMAALDYQFQDHTKTHTASMWADNANVAQWLEEINYSQAKFLSIDASLSPMKMWNQSGGSGEGFASHLKDTLLAHGYIGCAGRVGLAWDHNFNFHYGYIDDPFAFGRCYVYSWSYNYTGESWTWQEEVNSIITKFADGTAQGLMPIVVFHSLDADAGSGLDSICSWIVAQNVRALGFDDMVTISTMPTSYSYGSNIAASLAIDRDGNDRPDGWTGIDMDLNGTAPETVLYGIPPGKLIVTATVAEPNLSPSTDAFQVSYVKTHVAATTFVFDTAAVNTSHTIIKGSTLAFADTLDIGDRIDRIAISFSGIASSPFVIYSFSAIPTTSGIMGGSCGARYALPVTIESAGNETLANIGFHLEPEDRAITNVYYADTTLIGQVADARVSGDVTVPWNIEAVVTGQYIVRVMVGQREFESRIMVIKP